jgi:hypothetical protein
MHFSVVDGAVFTQLVDDQSKGEGGDVSACSVVCLHWILVYLSASLSISMVPVEILVVMPRSWKKEVFLGPRPVF